MRKMLCFLLALTLCVGFVPAAALAADEEPIPIAEEWAEEPADDPIEENADEPIEDPVKDEGAIEEPAEEPAADETDELLAEDGDEPVEEPLEEDAEEAGGEPVEEPAEEGAEETNDEPAEEDAEEPDEDTPSAEGWGIESDISVPLDGATTTPATVTVDQANERLQNLISMFEGKFFTVNGSACTTGSHAYCSNCLASSVVATSWVKSLVGMGTLSASNFPAQYYTSGSKGSADGYSCYGFANFAHWYIFAQKNTDNLVSTLVTTGSLTYATISQARPGDVIRFSCSWTEGHSAIFISCDSSGFKVLDCNYKDSVTGRYACQVKVHTLSYESSGTCAITGVQNYDRARTYLEKCTAYPSYLTVKVTSATTIKSLPCSKGTDSSSTDIYTAQVGETFTVTGMYKNTAGNYWYKTTYNGKTGYIYGGNVSVQSFLTSDITISGANYPTTLTKGTSFYIAGTVSSTYNILGSVSGYIYSGSTAKYSKTASVDAYGYSLKGSTIDSALLFSKLAAGSYTYKITAVAKSYYTVSGSDLYTSSRTVTLLNKSFTVAAETTCTITYNANGGSCSTTSATVTKGGTLSSLPTPTRTGYTFDGWYTAASGGTKVTTSTTFSANTTLYAHWTVKTYTITYNANGGTGAPASQTKTYGTALTLSTTVPTRTGYAFLGWSTSSTATTAAYSPGDSYTTNAAATLYAVWAEVAAKLMVSSATALQGNTVTLTVYMTNNPGVQAMVVTPEYNTTYLTLTSVTNGAIFDSLTKGTNLVFDDADETTATGVLCKMTFAVKGSAPDGDYAVNLIARECTDGDGESLNLQATGGTITIGSILYGDVNGDGKVNTSDLALLRKYLAGYDYSTGTSTVTVYDGADANGDGKVNTSDLALLRKYLANYDYSTGSSSVTLGP